MYSEEEPALARAAVSLPGQAPTLEADGFRGGLMPSKKLGEGAMGKVKCWLENVDLLCSDCQM